MITEAWVYFQALTSNLITHSNKKIKTSQIHSSTKVFDLHPNFAKFNRLTLPQFCSVSNKSYTIRKRFLGLSNTGSHVDIEAKTWAVVTKNKQTIFVPVRNQTFHAEVCVG